MSADPHMGSVDDVLESAWRFSSLPWNIRIPARPLAPGISPFKK
jgi:hypothetical protein